MKKLPLFIPLLFLLFTPLAQAHEFTGEVQTTLQDDEGVKYFKEVHRAAEGGDIKAKNTLGLLYEKGMGVLKSYTEALRWFKEAARKGNPEGQNNLGFLYFKGLGVKQDDQEALRWFQKAADQGLASAQSNLGLMYGQGLGVKKDYAKAFEWFQKAAEQDDADSQVDLGVLYSLGEGVSKDPIEAHKWFTLALRHQSLSSEQVEELRGDIEWLEKHMVGKQLDEARNKESAWKPVFSR